MGENYWECGYFEGKFDIGNEKGISTHIG